MEWLQDQYSSCYGLVGVGAVGGTIIASSAIGAGTVLLVSVTSGLVGAYTSQAAATEAVWYNI